LSSSSDGDVSGNHGAIDVWVVKLDASGSVEWEKSYGGSGEDSGTCIRLTAGGGFVVVGATKSTDGDVSEVLGDWDLWVLKLNDDGALLWQGSFGGSGSDGGNDVVQTSDGGFALAANTNSTDGDVAVALGGIDMWLVKLTGGGDLQWERSFRGTGTDAPFSLVETPADGYAAVGITSSSNGDVTGYHGGFYDQWVVRVDAAGELLWQKAMGGSADDRAAAIQRTEDGGYVIAGFSNSNDGDVTSAFPGYDLWLVKLAADDVSIPEHEPIWTLDVYPNPTAGDLAIAFTVPTYTMVRIEIRDVTGLGGTSAEWATRTWAIPVEIFHRGSTRRCLPHSVPHQRSDGIEGIGEKLIGGLAGVWRRTLLCPIPYRTWGLIDPALKS